MADIINTLKDMEELFWTVTSKILGLDTTLAINQGKVRRSWQTSGVPSWKITEDITFIQILPLNDDFAKQRDVGYSSSDSENAKRSVNYSRVFSIGWTCYGPNSFDNIEIIRNGIFLPTYKDIIKKKNMFLVTDVGMPQRVPELFNGQWWERCDLQVRYNEGVERSTIVPYLQTAKIQIEISKPIVPEGTPVTPYVASSLII